MKKLFILSLLAISTSPYAREDIGLQQFNESLNREIKHVVDQNPQMYETKEVVKKRRAPASVEVEVLEPKPYDKDLGLGKW